MISTTRLTWASRRAWIGGGFILFALAGAATGHEPAAPSVQTPDAGEIVAVPGLKAYALGELKLSFVVGRKGVFAVAETAGPRPDRHWVRLPLPYLSAPSAQRVVDDKIVILGEAAGGVQTVVLLDQNARVVLDSFWCLNPAVSPDRTQVVYTMVTQPHAPEEQSEFAAVYDLRANRVANRTEWPAGAEDIDVGVLLYPATVKFNPARDVWQGPVHSLGPRYRWSADSRAIRFQDNVGAVQYDVVATRTGAGWLVTRVK